MCGQGFPEAILSLLSFLIGVLANAGSIINCLNSPFRHPQSDSVSPTKAVVEHKGVYGSRARFSMLSLLD